MSVQIWNGASYEPLPADLRTFINKHRELARVSKRRFSLEDSVFDRRYARRVARRTGVGFSTFMFGARRTYVMRDKA